MNSSVDSFLSFILRHDREYTLAQDLDLQLELFADERKITVQPAGKMHVQVSCGDMRFAGHPREAAERLDEHLSDDPGASFKTDQCERYARLARELNAQWVMATDEAYAVHPHADHVRITRDGYALCGVRVMPEDGGLAIRVTDRRNAQVPSVESMVADVDMAVALVSTLIEGF